jgi:hypothetical protein
VNDQTIGLASVEGIDLGFEVVEVFFGPFDLDSGPTK